MKRCTKCILPETYASIKFDEEGVCSICKQAEHKREIDWSTREKELKKILDKYKNLAKEWGNSYDCIVPFSGGKDSSYTLYMLKRVYGMKPLAVTFDHLFLTDVMKENRANVLRKLGVDLITFSPDWQVVKRLCVKSLNKTGDFCWHCHSGIFAYPTQIAVKYNIPLLIWGEPSAEYTSYYTYDDDERLDEKRFKDLIQMGIPVEEMTDDGMTLTDLSPYIFPSFDALKELNVSSIYLGSYIPWDSRKQVELIKRELGWKGGVVEGSFVDYDKVECKYIGVRDYLKYIKRGYGRTAQLASVDIRNGRMTREEALRLAEEYDGKRPASLDSFLEDIEMSE